MKLTRPLVLAASALTLFVSACSTPADVGVPTLEPQFGTPATDSGEDVAVDLAGRVYVVGVTEGDLARPSLGEGDAFVRRYARRDRASVVWQRQFGTTKEDAAFGAATGPTGDLYVVGRTSGSLAADNPDFSEDAFVRKYTRDGAVVWTRQFGSTGTQAARAVAVDAAGSVYVAGETGGDLFVRKYTPAGAVVWRKQLGEAASTESVAGVTLTPGGVFVAGTTSSTAGGREQLTGFVRRLTADGAERWARTVSLGGDEVVRDVAAGGGVYVTGSVTVKGGDFSGEDGFLRKYDESGRVVWTRQFGSDASDSGEGVSVDPGGNVYLAGVTQGALADSNSGSFDAFAQKYTGGGNTVWTRQIEVSTGDYDYAYAVAAFAEDQVYLTGFRFGSRDAPDEDVFDAFVTRLGYDGAPVWGD